MSKYFVHVTQDFALDIEALYESAGESAGQVRDALFNAIRMLKSGAWDSTLINQYGITGTSFSFDFCSGYIFTFRIDTYRDERKQPLEEHYYLKNLLRKK